MEICKKAKVNVGSIEGGFLSVLLYYDAFDIFLKMRFVQFF